MRFGGLVTAAIVFSLAAVTSSAQTLSRLSALQIGIACAPPPVLVQLAPDAIRVVAAQDVDPREVLGVPETFVLSGGAARGLALGQEYYVRRVMVDQSLHGDPPRPVLTSGWVTIVGVNETTAVAAVENACGPIMAGDYLEPFAAPNPPPDTERVDASGRLDFTAMGLVVYGSEQHRNVAAGDFLLIDQGVDRGFAPGARVAFYRDPETVGLPLVAIGEAVVVSVGPTMSLVRVNTASGEVRSGDYVVPRR
ncbi:MAG: hypothetical protein HY655_03880 [Acidobacteria bacterium]|nr:hypothetical protein [Acidobacteriota bacterium]